MDDHCNLSCLVWKAFEESSSKTSLTIELAMEENLSLTKLPAHCTNVLQPPNMACYITSKGHYEKYFTDFVHHTDNKG